MNYYLDYVWKKGVPLGIKPQKTSPPKGYRIIVDPYKKRFSLEVYHEGKYFSTLYDSGCFDFRKLFAPEQRTWQREEIKGGYLIRDEDHRVILFEEFVSEKRIHLKNPQGILVGIQEIYGESESTLFDTNNHAVFSSLQQASS